MPIGPFFSVCSILMAVLAVVFTGHGIKALQEAGVIMASPIDAVNVSALGFYPTIETALAQAITLILVIGAFAWAHVVNRQRATQA